MRKFKNSYAQVAHLSDLKLDESEGEDNTYFNNLKYIKKYIFDQKNVHLASQILLEKLVKNIFLIFNFIDRDAFSTACFKITTLIRNTVTDKVI